MTYTPVRACKRIAAFLTAGLLMLTPVRAQAASHTAELQEILDSILTEEMTDAEKVEAITKYVGDTYPYDGNGHTYESLLQDGCGDCWASTDMIVHLADLAGLKAVYHDASRDPAPPFYGAQHICAQILADGCIYLADAGFSDDSAVQYYIIPLEEAPYRIQEHEDGTISARTYAGFDTEVIVPETIGGKTVTEIGNWAFQQWQLHGANAKYFAFMKWEFIQPETVTLPDTITTIGKGAFYQNDLQKIYLPASLASIGENAFYQCTNLTDIYYAGTEEQWQAIAVADGNDALGDAVIHYQADGIQTAPSGDVNADGAFDVSDVVLMQKWLLAVPDTHLSDWKAADFSADDSLDIFDLALMKRALLN